jgi:transposase
VATLEATPEGATHWSRTSMAKHAGVSESSVGRIWRAFRLQPHRAETFKLSNDPFFVEKVRDVVGLYMSPPSNAVVLSVDEKSQIQALNRTQPLLPMTPGQVERRSHDYERHGTTSLFAALDVATGRVIGKCYEQHRAKEFVAFLKVIDSQVDTALDVHLIVDNYSTHKAPAVKRWLARHPRFIVHFTPTYSSWLNQVERVFADLTERQIKRGAHCSVAALEQAIEQFLTARNRDPRPFEWTKDADQILASVARSAERTLAIHRGGLSADTSGGGH